MRRPNAINSDMQKRRFALILHAGYGKRWVHKHMKAVLIICILLSAELALAGDYPVYYERVDSNAYSLIILHDSSSATYLSRITRNDGTTWFYCDLKAVWGYYPKIDGKKSKPSLWIKTSKFRFDYFEDRSNLVEIDKMGPQGEYVHVKNECESAPQPGAKLRRLIRDNGLKP